MDTDYIARRIEPRLAFYQRRLPRLSTRQALLLCLLLAFSVASAVLARYGLASVVVVVTSAASLLTSWTEFADLQRKTERHNRAIRALRKLLSWWHSLSEVEKASTEAIAYLVLTAEAAINDERLGWGAGGGGGTRQPEKQPAGGAEQDIEGGQAADGGGGAVRRRVQAGAVHGAVHPE